MIQIDEYKVLTQIDSDRLSDEINQSIKDGWQPYGFTIYMAGFHWPWKQPMVKYKRED